MSNVIQFPNPTISAETHKELYGDEKFNGNGALLLDDLDTQEVYDLNIQSGRFSQFASHPNIQYSSQFMEDYKSYIGSMITPSGKVRSTPASKKDAWRYAIDEYRKRKRELNPYASIEAVSDGKGLSQSGDLPSDLVSVNILVNKIFDKLEERGQHDYEICRYMSVILYTTDVLYKLNPKTRARVMKYFKTVNVSEIGSTDKQIGIALNYEISGGSQCRRLVSIKKRLVERMASIGVTKLDLGK